MMKLQSHSTSNPTSIAQKAAVEALRGPQESVPAMLAEYRKRRDFVVPRLRAIPGVDVPMPAGAFYAYPNIGEVLRAQRDRDRRCSLRSGCWRKRTSRWCRAKRSERTSMCASPMRPR